MKITFFIIVGLFVGLSLQAQTDSTFIKYNSSDRPTIELNPNKLAKVQRQKKKRVPRNKFYGVRAKKRVVVHPVRGRKQTIETFYTLRKKNYRAPDPYVPHKYYYGFDPKKKYKCVLVYADCKEEYGMPLHGTYKKEDIDIKSMQSTVVEQGIYYFGVKHGRWEMFQFQDTLLIDKKKFYKGFPKEAVISYYDVNEKTLVKEVIPYQNGVLEGTYLRFYDSGRPAVIGEYLAGEKVHKWTEFYDRDKANRKIETQYKTKPHDDNFKPKVINEWDEFGKQVIKNGNPVNPSETKEKKKSKITD
jgi:antitoxin component YwqK of YwqJK toxin-antitoxin module